MTRLFLSFLGAWQVTLDEEPVNSFKYDKSRALLAYLAVEAERPHRREALAGMLWPELPERTARNNLRQALHGLREAIADRASANGRSSFATSPQTDFVLANRPTIQFNPESDYWLDVTAFRALLAASENHPHRSLESCQSCARRLQEAVEMYRGDFLAEFFLPDSVAFEEWSLLKREWLRRLMLDALTSLDAYHERRGQHEEALRYSWRRLELDPWSEEAHRQVMRLHLLSGDRSAALAQYETCRRLLAQELAVEPEAETTALYQQLQEVTEDLPIAPERLGLPAEKPHTLPPQPTAFVGREAELLEMGRLLDNVNCRLLTLTGPGGIGKTRLALQAAAEQIDAFRDGVFFVPLVSLSAVESLPNVIAEALKLTLQGPEDSCRQLSEQLREKELLLVLDNFEHLLDGAQLLADILRRAPDVTVLVTSRERLHLQGEWLFPVQGLPVPEPTAVAAALEAPIADYDAVQLFIQSARRVQHDFRLTAENEAGIVRICPHLGGLPLAIELAAAWTRVLSCAEIAREIEKSLDFLSTSLGDVPERHRSLEAVFEPSWQLLSEREQGVLAKLAVFQGGFDRTAAQQVAGASLPILAELVDKSLLRWSPSGRYEMHPLLHQYVAEKLLACGELETTRASHLVFFLDMAEVAASEKDGEKQAAGLKRLERENDNLRAALAWSLPIAYREEGVRLAVALYRFWYWRSHFREGSQWLQAALDAGESLPAGTRTVALRAEAFYAAGVLLSEQDDYAQAEDYLEESLALRRQLADKQGQAASLNSLGVLAWSQKRHGRAMSLLEESLALRRELGDIRSLAPPLNNLGLVALAQGDPARAQKYFEEILTLDRVQGNEMGIATCLSNLAATMLDQNRHTEAESQFRESLALFRKLGDREGIAWSMEGLAAVAAHRGEAEQAARLCGAAEALREAINAPLNPAERSRYERTLAAIREHLDEATFAAARAEGQAMTAEDTFTYDQG